MNALFWVFAGFIAYPLLTALLRARGTPPEYVRIQGPLTTVHTRRGRELLDRIATSKRFRRAWSNVGSGIALVIMVGTFVLPVFQAVIILQNPPAPTQVDQPQNSLAIPGVNDSLPLLVMLEILFSPLIGLVVHKGDHGVFSRAEGIDVEPMGVVLLTIPPMRAFVESSEESQRHVDRGGKSQMFTAGVTSNFAVTLVASALLFDPVIGSISVAPGVAVFGTYAGSPADAVSVSGGDRVTAVKGTSVNTTREFDAALLAVDTGTVSVELDGEWIVSAIHELVVVGSVAGNPANLTAGSGPDPIRVIAVSGTATSTRANFESTVGDSRFARPDTPAGERTILIDAYITNVTEDGPLYNATGTVQSLTVSSFNGEHITSSTELQVALDRTDPGQTVAIKLYRNDGFETAQVTLDENPQDGNGFLGVNIFQETSGLLPTDFGTQEYPTGIYLSLLGGDNSDGGGFGSIFAGPPLQLACVSLLLPLTSVTLGTPNFPGLTCEIINPYQVGGPLGSLGDDIFTFTNVLFWAVQINLRLGPFDCIPGYPFDGGRILRISTEVVISQLSVDNPHTVVRIVMTSIGLTMLASPAFMISGSTLLG